MYQSSVMRKAWRYQRDNQKLLIEEAETLQGEQKWTKRQAMVDKAVHRKQ